MQVTDITVGKLFHLERRHVVPLYQRPYVWQQQDQWEPLWEDVRSVVERPIDGADIPAHFLGAIVLEYVPQPTGSMETRLVIDGQQRLTTIQLLLEAFYDYCGSIGENRLHKAIERLVRNDDPMSEDPIERYKVWPTNVDRPHFERVMEANSMDELKAMYDQSPTTPAVRHNIVEGYLYFYQVIAKWAEEVLDQREDRLGKLIRAIKDRIRLVVIDVEKGDDAQVIFETLNARNYSASPWLS